MPTFLEADYESWSPTVVRWPSIDDFIGADKVVDGVHVIDAHPGPALEVLIRDVNEEPTDLSLPVFFTGAVDKRSEKIGPFFSGSGLSEQGGFGFVSISDPSLSLGSSLGLAWYAGNQYQDVQGNITGILKKISDIFGRELVLVGGSGGGFAALYFGFQLADRCSVLAWNPQTDIFKYNPTAVKGYFSTAYSERASAAVNSPSWENPTKEVLASEPITYDLCSPEPGWGRPRRLLVMQNASDWHVPHHLAPFLRSVGFRHMGRGVYETDVHHMAVIADFGLDHAPLPAQAVLDAVLTLRETDASVSLVLRAVRGALPAMERPLSSLPRDLRSLAGRISDELGLLVERTSDGFLLKVEHGSMPVGYGGARYSFFLRAPGEAPTTYPLQAAPTLDTGTVETGFTEVGVVVRDGFLNEILVIREAV